MKILVVEDDLLQSSWLENSLNDCGYEARCAYEGDDALCMWKLYCPDLVITDYRYPGKTIRNGLDLIAAVWSIDPLQAFVMQTAEKNLAVPFGVRVIWKPYPLHRLLRLIKVSSSPLLSFHR